MRGSRQTAERTVLVAWVRGDVSRCGSRLAERFPTGQRNDFSARQGDVDNLMLPAAPEHDEIEEPAEESVSMAEVHDRKHQRQTQGTRHTVFARRSDRADDHNDQVGSEDGRKQRRPAKETTARGCPLPAN